MKDTTTIQSLFFDRIKEQLPSNLTLVNEIEELLGVSMDSAYRRIRGEKELSFEEIKILSNHYGISVDALIGAEQSETVTFEFKKLKEDEFDFEHYLGTILEDMKKAFDTFGDKEKKEIFYIANDIPLFPLFYIPEIASFKLFFWEKTILNFKRYEDAKFVLNKKHDKINELSREIKKIYIKTPSIEVFNAESVDTTLKQIEYYFVSGLFEKNEDAIILCDKFSELVQHLQKQASLEMKFNVGTKDEDLQVGTNGDSGTKNFQLYYNEVLHIDNTILIRSGDNLGVYLVNNGLVSLKTNNNDFYHQTHASLEQLLKKSTLISGASEKERNRIFLNYQDKIKRLKELIS